jgi:hypothetical protein
MTEVAQSALVSIEHYAGYETAPVHSWTGFALTNLGIGKAG